MKRKWIRILYVLVVLGVIALVVVAFLPSPLRVETARVTRGPLWVTVDEEGETRAHDRFVIAAPIAGSLTRVELHDGDPVLLNQVIAVIHPLPIDQREHAEITAHADVVLRSPVRGRVLRVIEKSERVVPSGSPIVTIGDPGKLEIVIDLLSTDAVKVKPGMAALLANWGGESALRARIRTVEPSAFTKVSALGIEEQRTNVVADFVDPTGPLGDGYRVDVRIIIWEADSVLKIPTSALFRYGDGWSCFVVENGRAKRRQLEIGHRSQFEVEVVNGLEEGAQVILHPNNQIENEHRVEGR